MEQSDIQKMIDEAVAPLRMAIEALSMELEQAVNHIQEQEQAFKSLQRDIPPTMIGEGEKSVTRPYYLS